MPDREEDKARLRRKASQEAIALAMQSRWQEAVVVNQNIIDNFPTDVDAYNRMGRAYTELGEFAKAKEAYSKTLELDPDNAIAQKNLNRLSLLREPKVPVREERREVAPNLFIGEMGKAGVVNLQNLAPEEVLAQMAAGNRVNLKVRNGQLIVENEDGEYLGMVEPQHGLRLAKLMEGGNRYIAAIVSMDHDKARILVRETFQHPSQAGRLSFPVKAMEGFQPHVRDTLLRHGTVEEEALEEVEFAELEEGELLPNGFSIFEGVPAVEEEEEMPLEEDLIEED
ncbi:MAG: tetratricopeptide repeat protein [Chloroflexi bacterium]|nr:tetratricopeptide repeat protein [Chloroflexota bacterium]MBM3182611.1 tetratricopeptide repeat protein [Chloroflexota bacterium]MBM4451881.1 tetratricopeptide repeat protein [Chloroflexota bacterium]